MKTEKEQSTYEKVKDWLGTPAIVSAITKALPKTIPAESWIQSALSTVRMDKDIAKATPISVMGVLMTAASMGLRLEGPMGQAYITVRGVKEKVGPKWVYTHSEAQIQVGYRGLIDLAYRDKNVREVESVIVYERDEIDFSKGSTPFINHRWNPMLSTEDRGNMVAVYSGLRYKDGFYSFELYPMSDIIEHRNKLLLEKGIRVVITDDGKEQYLREGDKGTYVMLPENIMRVPWLNYPIPMYKKTAIRWSAKYWPLSPDFHRAAELSALDDSNLSQNLSEEVKSHIPSLIETPKLAVAQNLSVTKNDDLARKMVEAATRMKEDKTTAQPVVQQEEHPVDVEQQSEVDPQVEELKKAQEEIERKRK